MWTTIEKYYYPNTIEEAIELFNRHQGSSSYISSGTSLVSGKNHAIKELIDISLLPLKGIGQYDSHIRIGSGTPLETIIESPLLTEWAGGLLPQALKKTRNWVFQQSATIGGVIMAKNYITEPITALGALDAQVEIAPFTALIPIIDFLTQLEKHHLEGSLITAIILTSKWKEAAGSFIKLSRTPSDLSILTAAGVVIKNGSRCEDLRLILGGHSPLPLKLSAVETSLRGKLMASTLIQQAVQSIPNLISSTIDSRASTEYRAKMAPVLMRRTIENCASSS